MRMLYDVTGGGAMPRIILISKKDAYSIWCKKVPPLLGGKRGELIIPNIERKKNSYEYLSIPRIKKNVKPKSDDIVIYLLSDPRKSGKIEIPYNGGDPDTEFTIKINWHPKTVEENSKIGPICPECKLLLEWDIGETAFICEKCETKFGISP